MDVFFLATSVISVTAYTILPRKYIPCTTTLTRQNHTASTTNKENHTTTNYVYSCRDDTKYSYGTSTYTNTSHQISSILFIISLILSSALLALSILELFPQSWLLWIRITSSSSSSTSIHTISTSIRDDDVTIHPTAANIIYLYRIVFWMITLHCMIVIPAITGIQITMYVFNVNQTNQSKSHHSRNTWNGSEEMNHDSNHVTDDKYRVHQSNSYPQHWMLNMILRMLSYGLSRTVKLVSQTLYNLCIRPLYTLFKNFILIPIVHKFRRVWYWCRRSSKHGKYPNTTMIPQQQRRRKNTCSLLLLPTRNNNSNKSGVILDQRHRYRWWCFIRCSKLWENLFRCRCRRWHDPTVGKCILYGSISGIVLSYLLIQQISPWIIEYQPILPLRTRASTDTSTSTALSSSSNSNDNYFVLLQCISSLCAIGIILSTIFNGFGSISLPYSCCAGLFVEPIITSNVISNAEQEIELVHIQVHNKKQDLNTLEESTATTAVPLGTAVVSDVSKSSSFWTTTINYHRGAAAKRTITKHDDTTKATQREKMALLFSEIQFLQTLLEEMSENVEEMRYAQSISSDARTTMGKFRLYLGIVFSIILLLRLASALSNVGIKYVTGRSSYALHEANVETNIDPVTRIILLLSGQQVVTMETLRTLSQCISLSLTAILSASQIRTFARTYTTVQRRMNYLYRKCYCKHNRFQCDSYPINPDSINQHRRHKMKLSSSFTNATVTSIMGPEPPNNEEYPYNTMRNVGQNTWFFSNSISFLLCCYCLACIVLTKMMLPIEYRTNFSNALFWPSNNNGNRDHSITPNANAMFTIRTDTIDSLYTITALISGCVFAIMLSLMRSNVRRIRYNNSASDDEEYKQQRSPSKPEFASRPAEGIV
jgi:The Golgi pH Regulator (GPHR) Family N-terminal